MEAQSWVKKFNFFKEKNSARYFQNNGETINLIKKYILQNRFEGLFQPFINDYEIWFFMDPVAKGYKGMGNFWNWSSDVLG